MQLVVADLLLIALSATLLTLIRMGRQLHACHAVTAFWYSVAFVDLLACCGYLSIGQVGLGAVSGMFAAIGTVVPTSFALGEDRLRPWLLVGAAYLIVLLTDYCIILRDPLGLVRRGGGFENRGLHDGSNLLQSALMAIVLMRRARSHAQQVISCDQRQYDGCWNRLVARDSSIAHQGREAVFGSEVDGHWHYGERSSVTQALALHRCSIVSAIMRLRRKCVEIRAEIHHAIVFQRYLPGLPEFSVANVDSDVGGGRSMSALLADRENLMDGQTGQKRDTEEVRPADCNMGLPVLDLDQLMAMAEGLSPTLLRKVQEYAAVARGCFQVLNPLLTSNSIIYSPVLANFWSSFPCPPHFFFLLLCPPLPPP